MCKIIVAFCLLSVCLCFCTGHKSPTSSFCIKPADYNEDGRFFYHGLTMRRNSDNSSECLWEPIKKITTCYLGEVQLRAYQYTKKSILTQTALNISFMDIMWKQMTFRIKEKHSDKTFCRSFDRDENSAAATSFYFDCLWSDEGYEGKTFELQVEATAPCGQQFKKLSFKIPFSERIDETSSADSFELFPYVETFDVGFWKKSIVVSWERMPDRFHIDCYEISTRLMIDQWVPSFVVGATNSTVVLCGCEEFCRFYSDNWFWPTSFAIRPVLGNNSYGFWSTTVFFMLREAYVFRVVSIVFWVILILILWTIIIVWRKVNQKARETSQKAPLPKILVLYSPTTDKHLQFVQALVLYMRNYCLMDVFMDEMDIPCSKSKDPFIWCNEMISSVDCVLVIASPLYQHIRTSDALYRTDKLLLRLLRERISIRKGLKIASLVPDYSKKDDLPKEVLNFKKFLFPEDFGALMKFLVPKTNVKTKYSLDLQTYGKEVLNCLKNAREDYSENGKNYLKLTNNEKEVVPLLHNQDESMDFFEPETFKMNKSLVTELAEKEFIHYPGNIRALDLLSQDSIEIKNNSPRVEQSGFKIHELDL